MSNQPKCGDALWLESRRILPVVDKRMRDTVFTLYSRLYNPLYNPWGNYANEPSQSALGNESVPIHLAQCWFRGLAISSAKY